MDSPPKKQRRPACFQSFTLDFGRGLHTKLGGLFWPLERVYDPLKGCPQIVNTCCVEPQVLHIAAASSTYTFVISTCSNRVFYMYFCFWLLPFPTTSSLWGASGWGLSYMSKPRSGLFHINLFIYLPRTHTHTHTQTHLHTHTHTHTHLREPFQGHV